MAFDPDDTVRLKRPKPPIPAGRWIVAGMVALMIAAGGGWLAWHSRAAAPLTIALPVTIALKVAPPPSSPPASVPPAAPPPRPAPEPALPALTSEAAILADQPKGTQAYRFERQPEIFVLQFASLADQASALNRAAALLEKAGYPHDHVLDEAELDRRIRAEGGTPATFYYGHDYRASDILRVFDIIARSGLPLSDGEAQLRQRVTGWGWQPGTNAALISIVENDPANGIDRTMRATILRHELSHGVYFTTPDYVRYSRQFWNTNLTSGERALFTKFLAREGYDVTIADLVINETQAYLMHTASAKFFNAGAVGIPQARLDILRGLFLIGMPPGWLRDCTTVPETLPRRRPHRGRISRRRVLPGRVTRLLPLDLPALRGLFRCVRGGHDSTRRDRSQMRRLRRSVPSTTVG